MNKGFNQTSSIKKFLEDSLKCNYKDINGFIRFYPNNKIISKRWEEEKCQ